MKFRHLVPKQTKCSIFEKPNFVLIVADQHMVCKVPSFEGICVAVIRLQDLSMAQIIDLTIFKIVQAVLKEKRARCNDAHGACEVIQQAIEKQRRYISSSAQGQALSLTSRVGIVIKYRGPST